MVLVGSVFLEFPRRRYREITFDPSVQLFDNEHSVRNLCWPKLENPGLNSDLRQRHARGRVEVRKSSKTCFSWSLGPIDPVSVGIIQNSTILFYIRVQGKLLFSMSKASS
jgi:hypothetical protein